MACAADAAEESFRAFMIAAPRCWTAGTTENKKEKKNEKKAEKK